MSLYRINYEDTPIGTNMSWLHLYPYHKKEWRQFWNTEVQWTWSKYETVELKISRKCTQEYPYIKTTISITSEIIILQLVEMPSLTSEAFSCIYRHA